MFKLSFVLLALVVASQTAPVIEPALLKALKNGSVNLILTLSYDTTSNVLGQLRGQTFANRGDRLTTISHSLKRSAQKNQVELINFLAKNKPAGAIVRPFWISNKVSVRHADLQLVEKLAARSDVVEIRQELVLPLEQSLPTLSEKAPNAEEKANEEWNIQLIRAPPVWATDNRGQGIVVSNIDTGVRSSHLALVDNYRSNYGWFDPEDLTETPSDPIGLGTYTMGIIAGKLKIGVAPGAQWVACKGCGISCSEMALLACAEWVLCPTDVNGANSNCSLAPNVVSNSWGGAQPGFFEDVLATWRAGGIVATFGVGGGSGTCGSTGYPAASALAIAVGATTQEEVSATASGAGPTSDGRIKPDLAAPAINVRSASSTADDAFVTLSGTAGAGPHVAGVAALILCERPDLNVDQVQKALHAGAKPTAPTGRNCGDVDEETFPNNHVGWGRLDATSSVASAIDNK